MTSETLDFDAWRTEQRAKRHRNAVRIFGQDVIAPTGLSLDLAMRLDDEAESDDPATIEELVGELYGRDELQRWRESGCQIEDFELLLAWGTSRARGQDITFDRAAEILAERREGKAPTNRAERRAGRPGRKKRGKR